MTQLIMLCRSYYILFMLVYHAPYLNKHSSLHVVFDGRDPLDIHNVEIVCLSLWCLLYPYHLNNYSPFSFLCPKSANSCASWLLYTALQLLINRTDRRIMRNFPRNLVPVHRCPPHYLLNLARLPTGLSKTFVHGILAQ